MAQEPAEVTFESKAQELRDFLQQSQQAVLEMMALAPKEQARRMQEMQSQAMSLNLARSGFDDPSLIEAVQSFQAERVQARRPLRVTATLIYLANAQHRDRFSDAQFEALLVRYEAEIEAQRADERASEDDLDAKIGWKARPRLKAWLLQEGVIGDASWLARSGLAAGSDTEIEIVRFWNENGALPPELSLPDAPPSTE